ncbi:MAG: YidC/Oxa1 family membrane protein insertase [Actinomycetota bacterium]|nr:YidC/Oxa1 family membrane protein insertase [Actinomycetota bacterium]
MIEFLERVFAPLTGALGWALEYVHAQGAPWWLSIAIITVVVRTILFPLTVRQVKSMRAMQDLKPDMDKIRAQYKDNRQRQQEEIMKLYQERQVNPFGSCFPLLVQMPIFIGMFYVIRSFGDTHPSFTSGGILWFEDLSAYDPFYILPVLSAVTMLAASEITSKHIDPQQRWIMRTLPVVFTIFLLTFPAGLFMYWITSNLVTLVQNYVIYNYGPGKKSPEGGSGSAKTIDRPKTPTGSQKAEGPSVGGGAAAVQGNGGSQDSRSAKRKRRRKKKK